MATSQRSGLSRRHFLHSASAIAFASAAGLGTAMPAFAAPDQQAFLDFSQFVTGQALDPVLAARYLTALSQQDAGFAAALDAAMKACAANKDRGIDAMLADLDPADPVYETIRTVTSAWYLGVIGTGSSSQLIAFHDALMFRTTQDHIYVPTYGGGPDSWVTETHR